MASNKETIAEIVGEMRGSTEQRYCSSKHCSVKVFNPILDFADRIEVAYKREVAELRECLVRRSSHLNAILQKALDLREDVPVGLRKVIDECIVAEDKAIGLGMFSIRKGAEDEGK